MYILYIKKNKVKEYRPKKKKKPVRQNSGYICYMAAGQGQGRVTSPFKARHLVPLENVSMCPFPPSFPMVAIQDLS